MARAQKRNRVPPIFSFLVCSGILVVTKEKIGKFSYKVFD